MKINKVLITIFSGNFILAMSPIIYNRHREIDLDGVNIEEIM